MKKKLPNVRDDDEKIQDPSVVVDLRLTRTEWIIYWKKKYEDSLEKIVKANAILTKAKQELKEKTDEISKLRRVSSPKKKTSKKQRVKRKS